MNFYRFLRITVAFALVALFVTPLVWAKERSEVDDMDKWKTTDIYTTHDDFIKELNSIVPDGEKLSAFKGKLEDSPKTFLKALELYYDITRRVRRLQAYTSRITDVDTRVSKNKGYQDQVTGIATKFSKASSFIDPEIITIGQSKLEKFFKKEPKLAIYKFPVSETLRRQKHILSPKEEAILAAAGDITDAGYDAYSLFTDADMPLVTVKLTDGSELELSYPNFAKLRRSLVEKDRMAAWKGFFTETYAKFQRLLAQTLYSQLKTYNFMSTTRGYDSTLAAALDYNDINTKIYMSLIEAAHRNFDTFHRYLKLKARALGKESLEYTDMYLPFTAEVKIPVTYQQAQEMLIKALAPMGEEYVNTIKSSFKDGWIDVYPNKGKRSGAYASGWAYDVHPYVLMNYNGTYQETLTLAHELGHALHSFYSNKTQPFPIADYSTFVAEVASTFNENLLNDYMLKKMKSDDEKLYLLGYFLDNTIKGTFFRQTQFAEFELKIHQIVEKGQPLTDKELNKIYLDLAREYYGHDKGIVNVPEMIQIEWAVIPHFYYNYYVFQYSTSIAAASFLSEKVLNKEAGAIDAYYNNLLKAGGSDNPVTLLTKAGADMTKPETYSALMKRANTYMDRLEKILEKKGL